MAGRNGGFSATTVSFKIGTLVLFVSFILHVVGFSVARWATIKMSFSGNELFEIQSYYHAGLWQHCGCVEFGVETCVCTSRSGDPAWFKAVQAMEILGLIGLIGTGIISLSLLFYKQTMTTKNINIFLLAVSAVCIVIGLIIFGVENTKDFKDVFAITDAIDSVDAHGTLSTSFILCAIAAGLCLFVCLPLFAVDRSTPIPPPLPTAQQQMFQAPVQYSNQGQVIVPPPGQAQVFIGTVGQQPTGYMPTYTYGQHGLPPAYAPQTSAGPYGAPSPQQTDGIPYKA
ncbi:uncharacterized protein LOC123556399 [Mercenaria mercenaria]|uniref:uncharacterized protein LOC123556399 n=1 Tax=Mercenaria mercenaria TaxID=6596 RepID=UPI00234EFFE5|nr:uncharacterized protein LOC123556399 [Mercenaria mercenaria]